MLGAATAGQASSREGPAQGSDSAAAASSAGGEPAEVTRFGVTMKKRKLGPDDVGPPVRLEWSGKYILGVEVAMAGEALAAQLELPAGKGLVVEQVVPEAPAAKAGVKQHDVLLSLGGTALAEPADLPKALDKVGPKQTALELIRGGKKQTVQVTPAENPIARASTYGYFVRRGEPGFEGARITFTRPVYAFTRPLPAVAVEFPKDLKVVITKQGPSPAEVIVTRGDKKWSVTDKTLGQLPEEVRKPVQQFLSRSAGEVFGDLLAETITFGPDGKTVTATNAPLEMIFQRSAIHPEKPGTKVSPPPAPRDSIEKRLDEISRRLEAIEKTLKQDKR